MFPLLYRYLLFVGLLCNLALALLVMLWGYNKVQYLAATNAIARQFIGPRDGVAVTLLSPVESGSVNPEIERLPVSRWIKIHEQIPGNRESFAHQGHSGATFDPERGQVLLFGSDTHGNNWDNTVRLFDMGELRWTAAYPPDGPRSYRVTTTGLPVAGDTDLHPWAMHSLDAVEFDPQTRRMFVLSHPAHLDPSRFPGIAPQLWSSIKVHPLWTFHAERKEWAAHPDHSRSFFPYGVTYAPSQRLIIGVEPNGYWEFDIDLRSWKKAGTGTPYDWNFSTAFDSHRDIVVSFGGHKSGNDLWQYPLGSERGRLMPTSGVRPPGGESVALVYYPKVRAVIALNREENRNAAGITRTWAYSTGSDSWRLLDGATLPFALGMNYCLIHDPNHEVLVLVGSLPGEPTAVWVLRLDRI